MVFNMEAKSIEDVPVVREYPDVFPEELPGMPPDRDISLYPIKGIAQSLIGLRA
jgi:hypothetical protein